MSVATMQHIAVPGPVRPRVRISRSPWVGALVRVSRNPMGLVGGTLLGTLLVAAVLAPVISPYNPVQQHPGAELQAPGATYWLGTDQLGRDLLSRIIWGARNSLLVGVLTVVIGGGIGIATGVVAGYLGGWVEIIVMRLYDALMAFPPILLGVAVVTVLGPGLMSVAYALSLASLPLFARLARSTVLSEREKEYVQAARCTGLGNARIMFGHVLPNAVAPLIVQLSLMMGVAVLAESGLSFLGLGTQPPDPSWGAMLNDSRAYLRQDAWYGVWPGVALAVLLLGLNYFSDALREAFDPRRVNA
jgi:peptide/nickel transport system permease protein